MCSHDTLYKCSEFIFILPLQHKEIGGNLKNNNKETPICNQAKVD